MAKDSRTSSNNLSLETMRTVQHPQWKNRADEALVQVPPNLSHKCSRCIRKFIREGKTFNGSTNAPDINYILLLTLFFFGD